MVGSLASSVSGAAASELADATVAAADLSAGAAVPEAAAGSPLVALVDTGAPEGGNVVGRASVLEGDESLDDPNGHGTAMLETIVSENEGARVMSVRALGADGRGTAAAVYAAVGLAAGSGAKVLNLSFAGYAVEDNAAIAGAVADARAAGCEVVAAAGNAGMDARWFTPASLEGVFTCGAAAGDGSRLPSSNYGEAVDAYIYAQSTSHAAARATGWLSANLAPGWKEAVLASGLCSAETRDSAGAGDLAPAGAEGGVEAAAVTKSGSVTTVTYSGEAQAVSLSAGTYRVELWGAAGGAGSSGSGGLGGYTEGEFTIASSQTLYVAVGGAGADNPNTTGGAKFDGGWNGGGVAKSSNDKNSAGASGGGATHIATSSGTLASMASSPDGVIAVAGGGGGGGNRGAGGAGGGKNGSNGTSSSTSYTARIGPGGTQSAGGASALSTTSTYTTTYRTGTFGQGAGSDHLSNDTSEGGGGGGWYGGGAQCGYGVGSGGGSGHLGGATAANEFSGTSTSGTATVGGRIVTVSGLSAGPSETGFVAKPSEAGSDGYARITQLSCTVTYTKADCSTTGAVKVVVAAGQEFTARTAGVDAPSGDWTLHGWSNAKTTGTPGYVPGTSYKPTGDLTLYPIYTRSLTFEANFTGGEDPSPATQLYYGGAARGGELAPPPERPGFDFLGWYDSSDHAASAASGRGDEGFAGAAGSAYAGDATRLWAGWAAAREWAWGSGEAPAGVDYDGESALVDPAGGRRLALELPAGKYRLEAWGAQGGYRTTESSAGRGGYSEGVITLAGPGATTVYVYAGGSGSGGQAVSSAAGGVVVGGFNGGGYRYGYCGGGGASDVRVGTDSPYARVLVAGGGGSDGATGKKGMYGGGESGGSSAESYSSVGNYGGKGGTQGFSGADLAHTVGSQATSGLASNALENYGGGFGFGGGGVALSGGYGGAGGGGWYGGSGNVPDGSQDDDRGGGGGSGWVYTADTLAAWQALDGERSSGWLLGEDHYLDDARTVGGDAAFDDPDGTEVTGHAGDGRVRVTRLSSTIAYYRADAETVGETVTVNSGESTTVRAEAVDSPAPSEWGAGWEFAGWAADASDTGSVTYAPDHGALTLTSDLSLYPVYRRSVGYSLNFSGSGSPPADFEQVFHGGSAEAIASLPGPSGRCLARRAGRASPQAAGPPGGAGAVQGGCSGASGRGPAWR